MNPFNKFKRWFNIAKKNYPYDHTAFALSTCFNDRPSVRMVLLKKILTDGFVFFTNIESNKGNQFKKNNNLSMCFYWENLNKQIRIGGKGFIVDHDISNKYFNSRPKGSRIGAWASEQSKEITNRKYLMDRYRFYTKKFGDSIPRPDYWVGIKICPEEFEFWQQGSFRLHRRELYSLNKKKWTKKYLSP